jgi:hypothetical protein
VNGAVIALLGVLGVLFLVFGSPFGSFDLDDERNVPAIYSAALWFCAALLALLGGGSTPRRACRSCGSGSRPSSSSSWPMSSGRSTSGLGLLLAGTVCGIASQVAEAVEYGPGDERIAAFDEPWSSRSSSRWSRRS